MELCVACGDSTEKTSHSNEKKIHKSELNLFLEESL